MPRLELPVAPPPVRCFLFEAYPLSVMAARQDYLPWFYSNYIQVACYKNFAERDEVFLEYYGPDQAFHSPYLKTQYLSWEAFASSKVNIVEFIISNLDMGYYFYCYVDEYFIPQRYHYHKTHFTHDIFIYGYDDSSKKFLISGFNEERQFLYSEVDFYSFEEAFKNNNFPKDTYSWTDRIYLFCYNRNGNYEFDLQLTAELLEDYLISRNSSEHFPRYENPIKNKIFGLETYDCLLTYYELLLLKKMRYDIRIPYFLKENKLIMSARLSYMQETLFMSSLAALKDSYRQVEEIAEQIFMLMMKYDLKAKMVYINNIQKYIQLLKEEEGYILRKVLQEIKQVTPV